MKTTAPLTVLLGFSLFLSAADKAAADADDPPSRVARMSYAEGSVSFQPAGTEDWVAAPLNRPLTTGDTLWADQQSRVELQLDGSVVRLSSSSEISFVNLGDEITQIQLGSGSLLLRVRRLDDNETYEIDTPNLAFSVLRRGTYRISIDESGSSTMIAVRDGQGEATGAGSAFSLYAGDSVAFSGTDQLAAYPQGDASAQDALDTWAADRDRRWDRSESARHVSPDVVGYEDLDEHGSWRSTPAYGDVWYPRGVEQGWAPYHAGHWSYIEPWGYTWVDDQPWGFAPFHYGRWIFADGAWGWVPSPPQPQGAAYVRPVYAPALVAWVGVGAGVAWFALGPREVYVPSYPVSSNYARNVNVSNTTVSTTVVNNVYNTTVVNNVTYVNRTVPGAVTATSTQAFSSAQPVAKNAIKVDQQAMAAAQVRRAAPTVVPTKQAVLGATRAAAVKPPQAVQTRAVVARATPPPPPPTFERRQEAIKNNGGKPLTVAQVRQIQPAAGAARPAAIRVAPPAKPVAVGKAVPPPAAKAPAAPTPPPAPARAANPPTPPPPPTAKAPPAAAPPPAPRAAPAAPAAAAIHPRELPAASQAAAPSTANSALEREHMQQQQQLQTQQAQERQRLQQQQEAEHERLAKQQADAARTAELERQHAQQTQQMQQAHLQAQQQLAAKQEEQKQAAAKQNEKRKSP
jgi:FecR protein